MSKKAKTSAESAPIPEALAPSQIKDKLTAIAAENSAAEELLQTLCNDAVRWSKLKARAVNMGYNAVQFTSLCGKMVRTRKEWTHIPLPARALAAFHGLLITLGAKLTEADEKAYAAAQSAE
jgi:hypothetical protein